MRMSGVWMLVLALLLGCSGLGWADGFPVNFATSFATDSANTLVKVEGNELRISINTPGDDPQPIQDYLVNVEQGTISQSPGEVVAKGGEGWQAAYDAVMSSLTSVRNGLTESGDISAESLGTTMTYLQNMA